MTSVAAFAPSIITKTGWRHGSLSTTTEHQRSLAATGNDEETVESVESSPSSYEIDEGDEQAEEHLADRLGHVESPLNAPVNGDAVPVASAPSNPCTRYDQLLKDVGLDDGSLRHVKSLPENRAVTVNEIFCNRELRMGGIRAIGFGEYRVSLRGHHFGYFTNTKLKTFASDADMDYTIAQYQQPAFDQLAFDGAKHKLVQKMGYPEEVLDFQYDHTMWTRGLIIDTQRGNFLKIDRHKYVRVAYHGFERMSPMSRKTLYSRTFNKVLSFSEKHFVNMDTLFQFVDAHLFALLIDLKDNAEYDVLDFKTYEEIYRDIRECVDLCHRDGVIKDEVAVNPEKYLVLDPGLLPMLRRFRNEGIKVFLLTNSYWEYTVTVMNYLYHGRRVDKDKQKENEWLELFDLVVVGSCKPAYMLDPYLNLFRVRTQDGSLLNTDGIYEIDALNPNGAQKFLHIGKVFQGGNWLHLHKMLEIEAGEEILYVGDHLYSDVLRSKRTLGWRSAFIMPELEDELRVFANNMEVARNIDAMRKLRDELDHYCEEIKRTRDPNDPDTLKLIDGLLEDDTVLKSKLTQLAEQWHHAHHPVWGAMFNAGYQDSRFAFFVGNYACLYTSKATNLGLCSAVRSFRTSSEGLPHDKLLDSAESSFYDIDLWVTQSLKD